MSKIIELFDFKTKPYEHQMKVLEKSWEQKYFALFMEMGTGKSKIAVDTIALLYQQKKIDAALIIAPKGVYHNWVWKEIPTHMTDSVEYDLLAWQPNITQKFKNSFTDLCNSKKLKIFVMNVEGLSTTKGTNTAHWFTNRFPNSIIIVDESTTIKNRKASRTKNIIYVGAKCKYKRILTGSPITQSPMDLYSQCEFLSPTLLNFKSYYSFQARYAVLQKRNFGPRSIQQIVGFRKLEELNEKLDSFSSRTLKKDCLDLPDKVFIRREVPLTPEQGKVYLQMSKLALAMFEDGQLSTTTNVLTQIVRLQQICCGFIKDDDGAVREIKNDRLTELVNVCEEASGKVIIWATFVHDIVKISQELSEKFGSDSFVTFYGETPQAERQDAVNSFQDPTSTVRFFVGNSRTGGFGITLTEADTVIYYSNNYDLEVRLQSEDRAHRIGQTKSVTYVDLVSPKTVDEKVLKALKSKQNLASQVLGEELKDWLTDEKQMKLI